MCLKEEKKKTHAPHVIHKTKEKREAKGRKIHFLPCGLVSWLPSGSDASLHLDQRVLLLSNNHNVLHNITWRTGRTFEKRATQMFQCLIFKRQMMIATISKSQETQPARPSWHGMACGASSCCSSVPQHSVTPHFPGKLFWHSSWPQEIPFSAHTHLDWATTSNADLQQQHASPCDSITACRYITWQQPVYSTFEPRGPSVSQVSVNVHEDPLAFSLCSPAHCCP